MIKAISAVFKYSFLVLVILVLSHVVEIKGVSISQHVLNGMHLISGFTPQKQAQKIAEDYSSILNKRIKEIDQGEFEVSPEDRKALERIIQRSNH
jgi:hypothetical protein